MPKPATHSPRPYSGMDCPECGIDAQNVVDTRFYRGEKRRRRECPNGHRFNTIEIPSAELERLRAFARRTRELLAEAVA